MAEKPVAGQSSHFLQGAGLFEQVGGSGDDHETAFAAKLVLCLSVELLYNLIMAPNDEQGGALHLGETLSGQIGSTPSGDDGGDPSLFWRPFSPRARSPNRDPCRPALSLWVGSR